VISSYPSILPVRWPRVAHLGEDRQRFDAGKRLDCAGRASCPGGRITVHHPCQLRFRPLAAAAIEEHDKIDESPPLSHGQQLKTPFAGLIENRSEARPLPPSRQPDIRRSVRGLAGEAECPGG
jgi:hypothetical protein